MDDQFQPTELLFRAVLPRDMYWKETGEPTSAAFKDSKGLSVDRDGGRSREDAADFLQTHLSGAVVHITVDDCVKCDALVQYDPKPDNNWHSLILRSNEQPELTRHQAKFLAQCAVVYRR